MLRKIILTVLIIFALSVSFSAAALAQEKKQNQQKMMEQYMKMMSPNENHAYFKNFVGEWDVTSTAWMQQGTPPTTSKNSSVAELILGGRFLKMTFKGTMFGQPFEGLQIVGYDNLKKKFVTFWIDNSSTSFYLTEGTRDVSSNVMTETGLWPDFMTGGTVKVRAITKMLSNDEFVYEMYMEGPDGKEFEPLENRSVRKK